jgi:hypothetical protein
VDIIGHDGPSERCTCGVASIFVLIIPTRRNSPSYSTALPPSPPPPLASLPPFLTILSQCLQYGPHAPLDCPGFGVWGLGSKSQCLQYGPHAHLDPAFTNAPHLECFQYTCSVYGCLFVPPMGHETSNLELCGRRDHTDSPLARRHRRKSLYGARRVPGFSV